MSIERLSQLTSIRLIRLDPSSLKSLRESLDLLLQCSTLTQRHFPRVGIFQFRCNFFLDPRDGVVFGSRSCPWWWNTGVSVSVGVFWPRAGEWTLRTLTLANSRGPVSAARDATSTWWSECTRMGKTCVELSSRSPPWTLTIAAPTSTSTSATRASFSSACASPTPESRWWNSDSRDIHRGNMNLNGRDLK